MYTHTHNIYVIYIYMQIYNAWLGYLHICISNVYTHALLYYRRTNEY